MILYIKHIDIEGPGTLGAYFTRRGVSSTTIDLEMGDDLPGSFTDINGIVSLGGPMNVYEEEKYPYLKEENEFIKKAVKENVPFLGLCLGSQLLAKALGAKVEKSPKEEKGFSKVSLTPEGQKDPLFDGVDKVITAFQWHEDTFEVPKGAALLASSEECPQQAFRAGQCAYGLQFHVEVTDRSIETWADRYFKEDDPKKRDKIKAMLEQYKEKKEDFDAVAETIYRNFERMMFAPKKKKSNK